MTNKIPLLITSSLLVLAIANAPASAHSKLILFPDLPAKTGSKAATTQQTAGQNLNSSGANATVLTKTYPTLPVQHPLEQPLVAHGTKFVLPSSLQVASVPPAILKGNTAVPLMPTEGLLKQFKTVGSVPITQPTGTFQPQVNFARQIATLSPATGNANLLMDIHRLAGPMQQVKPLVNPVAAHQMLALSQSFLKLTPKGSITKANIDQFVGVNKLAGNEQILTSAIGQAKFQSVLGSINQSLTKGEFKLVPIVPGTQQTGNGSPAPAGDNSTIVIDQSENGKTVYVPASQLSGPDNRTIDVDCKHCKVVIVGDNSSGGSTTDDRKIVVQGNGDKVVTQGDTANGTAGKAGGQITDDRQIVVDGNHDKVVGGGDTANGGNGASGGAVGQNGGNGGKVTDDRSVVENGHGDKVALGTDQATGGNGGSGSTAGGNGGNGGSVNDNRTIDINGNGSKASLGGSNVDGGNGGNGASGQTNASNGGNGGAITDHRNINDQGFWNWTNYGNDQANGGNGGNS